MDDKPRRRYGEVAKDAAIGGVTSAVGTAGLLAGTGAILRHKAPDLSHMLGTASLQHIKVFNPFHTAPMMRSLPEASRLFGKQLSATKKVEELATSGTKPSLEHIIKAYGESGINPDRDIKEVSDFKKKWGRSPGETMEKSVGLLSGIAATGVGVAGGAALNKGWQKKERQFSSLLSGTIQMTPASQERMTSKLSQLIALSSRIDDIIEMGAGILGAEALGSVFGRGGGWAKYARTGGAAAKVSAAIEQPVLRSASMATGGVAGPSLLNRIGAARTGLNSAIPRPIEAGGRGVGAVTGAPNVVPEVVAPVAPGLFHGVSGAPQSPGPFASMGAAAAPPGSVAATTATTSANTAQQIAQQAGQSVAGNASKSAKNLYGKTVATGGGLLIGGAMATPDWMTRQNQTMSAWLDDIISFADPRPRNSLGEFSGQEGGPDPNAMATTYKMPQPASQTGLGVSKAAGAVLAGGALGAIGSNVGKASWTGISKLVKNLATKNKSKIVH